jgi:uncharacterized protein (TIGR02996 family)
MAANTGEILEKALVADPDDLAAHSAYADWLTQEGDPRGEFIQIQLALEDQNRSAAERKKLQQRERELLEGYERKWLGELAPLLLGTREEKLALFVAELAPGNNVDYLTQYISENMNFRHGWSRGWLDRFECNCLSVEMARKLGRAPIARLLRVLVWRGWEGSDMYRYTDGPDIPVNPFRQHEVLARHPAIRNLRIFQYGKEVDSEEDRYDEGTQFERLAPLIERMPRLEELYIFAHISPSPSGEDAAELSRIFSLPNLEKLRILQYYHGHVYPLESLGANRALSPLTHLLCFPHSFAQTYDWQTEPVTAGEMSINRTNVRAILISPHLLSLTHLELRCCDGGDGMIEDIVSSGILKRLRFLDLRHGHVTDKGASLLASCPDAKNLEVLDLINNRLTDNGISALNAAGIPVRADRQNEGDILYYGDSE